jgi:hypothetical protein
VALFNRHNAKPLYADMCEGAVTSRPYPLNRAHLSSPPSPEGLSLQGQKSVPHPLMGGCLMASMGSRICLASSVLTNENC